MLTTPVVLMNELDISGDLTAQQQLEQVFAYSVAATFSGANPAGVIKLQASLDEVNWVAIDDSAFSISATGTTIWNVMSSNYRFVQVNWLASGGSVGTVTVKFYARGF